MSLIAQIKLFLTFFVSAAIMSLTQEVNGPDGWIQGGKFIVFTVTFFSSLYYASVIGENDANRTIRGLHLGQGALRLLLLSVLPTIMCIQQHDYSKLWLAFFGAATFGAVFDQFRNYYKGDSFFYIGKEAWTDRIIRWLNDHGLMKIFPLWYILVKVSIFAVAFLLTLRFYVNA